jgi:alpha-tubulin suppressor-like RCC1 family protein
MTLLLLLLLLLTIILPQKIKTATVQTQISTITAGISTTCTILNDRTAKCWGKNDVGQLGIGNTINQGLYPNQMGHHLPNVNLGKIHTAQNISCGLSHCCCVLKTGQVYCWGNNYNGELGLGSLAAFGTTTKTLGEGLPQVSLGTNKIVQSISTGKHHTCAILNDFTLKCWGDNSSGQLYNFNTSNTNNNNCLDGSCWGSALNQMGDFLSPMQLLLDEKTTNSNTLVKIVSAGKDFTCVILKDNNVLKCWGNNVSGKLGLGTNKDMITSNDGFLPSVNLGTGRYATNICTAAYHSCAILDDGTVKCWGDNSNYGQLGTQTSSISMLGTRTSDMGNNLPRVSLFTGSTRVTNIVCTNFHTCVLFNNGKIKCWGANDDGQLGQGHTNTIGDKPNSLGQHLPYISLGSQPNMVIQIATGSRHTCVILDETFNVKCWGYNYDGQLGLGHRATMGDESNEMGDFLPIVSIGQNRKALSISASQYNTCVTFFDGDAKCWGDNTFGQLGIGNLFNYGAFPDTMGDILPVVGLYIDLKSSISSIHVGDDFGCAILENVNVKCWGSNSDAHLGLPLIPHAGEQLYDVGNFLPCVELGLFVKSETLSVGSSHACVITSQHELKCWGKNSNNQLGGEFSNPAVDINKMGDHLPHVNVGTGLKVMEVGLGYLHTCVLLDDDNMKCFGDNTYGQTGIKYTTLMIGDSLPTISLGGAGKVKTIGIGGQHSCAILINGQVKCWGYNWDGELGLGNDDDTNLDKMGDFLKVVDLGQNLTAVKIAAGFLHTCVILNHTFQIKCWGENSSGQLGYEHNKTIGDDDGEMGDFLPTVYLGGRGGFAQQISLGDWHSCVLLDDFKLKCWGSNSHGQLGLESNVTRIGTLNGDMFNLPYIYVIGTVSPSQSPSHVPSKAPSHAPTKAPSRVLTFVPSTSPRNVYFPPTIPPDVLIGGVVGGVLGIFLIIGIALLLWKKYKDHQKELQQQKYTSFLDKTPSTIAFLTHDWGQDKERTNHKRVSKINNELKRFGIETWFDEERLQGEVVLQITAGIDKTKVVIVFITKRYMNKVDQKSSELDYCQMEFGYALRTKKVTNMIPVVMEAEMLDTSKWFGPVGAALGGQLYIDMSSEDKFDQGIKLLHKRICDIAEILPVEPATTTPNNIITLPDDNAFVNPSAGISSNITSTLSNQQQQSLNRISATISTQQNVTNNNSNIQLPTSQDLSIV